MNEKRFYTVKQMNFDLKKAAFKRKTKEKLNKLKKWCKANSGLILMLAPGVIGAVGVGVKGLWKHINLNKAKKVKELYCYDPALGHYWELKKKLTNKDWIKINKLKASGKSLGDILESMHVLK